MKLLTKLPLLALFAILTFSCSTDSIDDKADGDQRQGETHGPSGCLQGEYNHDAAEDHIYQQRIPYPEGQVIEDKGHIKTGNRSDGCE